jgi:hypothetical protein
MSQAPVTWQASVLPAPVPRPHPPSRGQGPALRHAPTRTGPSLPPPSNGRGAGQAEQAAAAQPGPRPVPGSRAGSRPPLNAAQGRRGPAFATFLSWTRTAITAAPPARTRRPRSRSGQPSPPWTSRATPPLPPLPLLPGPACRVGAGAPGVRARVPVCARAPASDPRPRSARNRPGFRARAPRPASPAAWPAAVHLGAPCKNMAGSVADSDAVVVSVAGRTRGAPFPPPPAAAGGWGGEELQAQPGVPPRGKTPCTC